jgi:Tol biopolymer transport system component
MKLPKLLLVLSLVGFRPALLTGSAILSVEDMLSMKTVQSPVLSPDGLCIVFTVTEPASEELSKPANNIDLWMAKGEQLLQLTFSPGPDVSPQWSPDGASIAFLSTRPGTTGAQVFSISPNGGESRQLTHHGMPVSGFAWHPNGKQLAFLAAEPTTDLVKEKLRRGDDEISLDSFDTDANAPFQRVWILDLATGESRLVPVGEFHVTGVSWSPDGSRLLVTLTDDANLDYEWTRSRLAVVPSTGGTPVVYCATRGRLARPSWLPDGRGISFLGASANGTEQGLPAVCLCVAMEGARHRISPLESRLRFKVISGFPTRNQSSFAC